jgi:hypothetical protein
MQTKRFHDIFESLDSQFWKHSQTIQYCCTFVSRICGWRKPNYLLLTIKFLNAIINSASKMAIRKTKYHFKRTDDTFGWDYVTHDHGIGRFGGLQKYKSKAKRPSNSFMPIILCMWVFIRSTKFQIYNGRWYTTKYTNWVRMRGKF